MFPYRKYMVTLPPPSLGLWACSQVFHKERIFVSQSCYQCFHYSYITRKITRNLSSFGHRPKLASLSNSSSTQISRIFQASELLSTVWFAFVKLHWGELSTFSDVKSASVQSLDANRIIVEFIPANHLRHQTLEICFLGVC